MKPFDIVREFENAICEYTGAPYCVTVTSCTMALFLALKWHFRDYSQNGEWQPIIALPKLTYISVPMQVKHAGAIPVFLDIEWRGTYQLGTTPIWDSARRFTSGMYIAGQLQCVSFHWAKILGVQQGGAILHDDSAADRWFRKARFDGRTEGVAPKDDTFDMLGWHCYMSPEIAAEGLVRLSHLPKHNADLPNDDYPDLSKMAIFR